MKQKLTEWILGISFAVVGTICIIVSLFLVIYHMSYVKKTTETTATIIDIATSTQGENVSYIIFISYYVDGKEYRGHYNTSEYQFIGDIVNIFYNNNNPSKLMTSPMIFIGMAFSVSIFGMIFGAIGYGIIINKKLKKKMKNKLLKNGDKIIAEYQEITQNYNYQVNGQNPYLIVCHGKYQRRI